jgi:hypothetical protein
MMNILTEDEFSTMPTSTSKSEIIFEGKVVDKSIDGTYLELCIKRNNEYFVFMTDDIPDEDMLHIHLLDERFNLIDSVTIGGIYSTGTFENVSVQEPNHISFNFIGINTWTVEALDKKQFCMPFLSSPKGSYRKNPFYQYFKLYGNPLPET